MFAILKKINLKDRDRDMIVVEDEYFHGLECDVGSLKVSFFQLFGDLEKCLVRDVE